MKLHILPFFILFFTLNYSQSIKLSNKAEVSIITVSAGKSLNDTWGHSAIRIKDNVLGIDIVFNYGMYDFNTPNFYTKFMRGKLLFDLGTNQFHNFLRSYIYQNRSITEQVLNLTTIQKQAYFDYLQNNAKPENRKYLYDFFFDNCATKLRIVNTTILKDSVIYNDDLFNDGATFRDLIYQKLDNHPWGKFGIDLALGSVIDRKAKPIEFTFLPSYTFLNFKTAQIKQNGKQTPLVKKTNILYQQKTTLTKNSIFSPILIFSTLSLLIIILTYFDYKNKKQRKKIDFIILFTTGLIGLLVFILWFATDHTATKNNFNILWAFLPNLFFAFYIYKESKQKTLKKYYLLLILLLFIMSFLWIIKIQIFNTALIPILIMLGVRYFYNYRMLNIKC